MSKAKRPNTTYGPTVKIVTGCGNSYVTCNADKAKDGSPFEIFCSLGKAGGCANCMNEALTRSITLGLRYGVPVEEYAKQLRGLGCPSPAIDPDYGAVKSCPEAIAKVMVTTWLPDKYKELWSEELKSEDLPPGQAH